MIRKAAPALCAALLALALGAGPAEAAEPVNHPFLPQLSAEFHPPGGSFEDACGVAVGPGGNIYVADYYRHAIDIFSSSGTFQSQITKEDTIDGPCGLAVDAAGNLYVNNYHRNVVKFAPSEFSSGPGTVIDSSHSTGVAVDLGTGNVYVDDRTFVAEYEPSGHPVEVAGQPVQIGLDSLADYHGVAVSSFPATAGDVYVADAATNTVKAYDPATSLSEPSMIIDGEGTPQRGLNSLFDSSVTVDSSNGHLFVANNTQPGFEHPAAVVDEFNAQGDYRGQLPHAIVDGEPTGLAVDAGGNVYATSGNWEGAGLDVFGPAVAGHRLAVTKSGTGEGTVSSEPAGVACGSACAAEYNAGAMVTLIASPAAGSAFAGWSGCAVQSGPECTLTMSADRTVEAEFEPAPLAPLGLPAPAPAVSAAEPAAPASSAAHLALSRPAVNGSTATVAVLVPAPGTLIATGRDLRDLRVLALAPGAITLHLRLNAGGRRALHRAKRRHLELTLSVAFIPADGTSPTTAAKTVTFKTPSREKR